MKTGARTLRGKRFQKGAGSQPSRAQVVLLLGITSEATPVPGIVLPKNNRKYTAEKLQPIQYIWVRLQPGSPGWGTPNLLSSSSHHPQTPAEPGLSTGAQQGAGSLLRGLAWLCSSVRLLGHSKGKGKDPCP